MATATKNPKVIKTTGANLMSFALDSIRTKNPITSDSTAIIGKNTRATPHENHAIIIDKIANSFMSPMPNKSYLMFMKKPNRIVPIKNRIEIPNLAHSPCQIAKVSQHNKVSIIKGTTILLGTLF